MRFEWGAHARRERSAGNQLAPAHGAPEKWEEEKPLGRRGLVGARLVEVEVADALGDVEAVLLEELQRQLLVLLLLDRRLEGGAVLLQRPHRGVRRLGGGENVRVELHLADELRREREHALVDAGLLQVVDALLHDRDELDLPPVDVDVAVRDARDGGGLLRGAEEDRHDAAEHHVAPRRGAAALGLEERVLRRQHHSGGHGAGHEAGHAAARGAARHCC
mmetsp:Transcript_21025/g.55672  ORF Transcript_21025/g.55672 Transcript_21025/m.55672 type:complete len:220 (-) Transcript_21025:113-772(-)